MPLYGIRCWTWGNWKDGLVNDAPLSTRVRISAVTANLPLKTDKCACDTCMIDFCSKCKKCVDVCPYSHPDNLLHNAIRRVIKASSAFRLLSLKRDDLFYGRNPKTKKAFEWMHI